MERHWKYQKYKDGIRNWSHTQLPPKSEPPQSDPPQSVPTQSDPTTTIQHKSDPSKTTAYQQHFPGDFQFAVFARFPQRHETVSSALVRCHVRGTFHAGVLALFQQTFLRVVPHQQTHLVNREEQNTTEKKSRAISRRCQVPTRRTLAMTHHASVGLRHGQMQHVLQISSHRIRVGTQQQQTVHHAWVARLGLWVVGRQKRSRGIVSFFDCTYISTLSVRRR